MIFKKRFSDTLIAIATFTISANRDKTLGLSVEWEGKPHAGVLRKYERWMVSIHQRVCDKLNIGLMYAANKPSGLVVWGIRPGLHDRIYQH